MLATRGFGGLTLRAVAAEMGVSTGLLTHYFPNKRALVRHAVDVAERHTDARDRHAAAGEGRPALRAALLDVLPLTDEATVMSRVWVSYWDGALADEEFAADQRRRYDRWRARLRSHVDAALGGAPSGPGADPDDLAATCAAFAHGLVVQALFDPAAFPAPRQVALLDRFLADLFPA